MNVLHACMYTHSVCAWGCREWQELALQKLELQMVISHSVSAGNQTLSPLQEQQVFLTTLYPVFFITLLASSLALSDSPEYIFHYEYVTTNNVVKNKS